MVTCATDYYGLLYGVKHDNNKITRRRVKSNTSKNNNMHGGWLLGSEEDGGYIVHSIATLV